MKILTVILCVFIFITSDKIYASDFKHYQTEGNLVSTFEVDCVPLSKLKNMYTPADLYPALIKCLKNEDVENGVVLLMLAGAFGRYDQARVKDKTAHQAVKASLMNNLDKVTIEKRKLYFSKVMEKMGEKFSPLRNELCKEFKVFGPPDYYPVYMIQHGMNAFLRTNDNQLLEGFDSDLIWEKVLKNYVKCE